MEEIWKDIPGYEGFYQVSNLGYIISLERVDRRGFRKWPTRILRPCMTKSGYLQVILCRNGQNTKRYIHHVVADVFLGPCPPGKERNHKNGNKLDNSANNLEYCTPSENHIHSYEFLGKKAAQGSRQPHAKLNEEKVYQIRAIHARGLATRKELMRIFGVSRSVMNNVINGKAWTHVK